MNVKEKRRRNSVVHGWAFREHTKEEKDAIRHYLDTGEVLNTLPEQYVHLNEVLK